MKFTRKAKQKYGKFGIFLFSCWQKSCLLALNFRIELQISAAQGNRLICHLSTWWLKQRRWQWNTNERDRHEDSFKKLWRNILPTQNEAIGEIYRVALWMTIRTKLSHIMPACFLHIKPLFPCGDKKRIDCHHDNQSSLTLNLIPWKTMQMYGLWRKYASSGGMNFCVLIEFSYRGAGLSCRGYSMDFFGPDRGDLFQIYSVSLLSL